MRGQVEDSETLLKEMLAEMGANDPKPVNPALADGFILFKLDDWFAATAASRQQDRSSEEKWIRGEIASGKRMFVAVTSRKGAPLYLLWRHETNGWRIAGLAIASD